MMKVLAGLCLITPWVGCSAVGAQEVRVYSGRHYNTDRQVFKRFSEKTGIKVRLIEATGISLVERRGRVQREPSTWLYSSSHHHRSWMSSD